MDFSDYLKSRPYKTRIPAVIRAARKAQSYSYENLCERLEISKKTYLDWETGKDFPDLIEWRMFCEHCEINHDSCRYGYIDNHKDIALINECGNHDFLASNRYVHTRAVANRWLIPLIEFLRFRLGDKQFKKLIQDDLGIDEDYFVLFDSLANFNLAQDLFEALVQLKVSLDEVRQIAQTGVRHLNFSTLERVFIGYHEADSIMKNIWLLNNKFDLNFKYEFVEVLESEIYIAATAAPWLKSEFHVNEKIRGLHRIYKGEWLKNAVELLSRRTISMQEIELDDKRDIDCLYQFQIA